MTIERARNLDEYTTCTENANIDERTVDITLSQDSGNDGDITNCAAIYRINAMSGEHGNGSDNVEESKRNQTVENEASKMNPTVENGNIFVNETSQMNPTVEIGNVFVNETSQMNPTANKQFKRCIRLTIVFMVVTCVPFGCHEL